MITIIFPRYLDLAEWASGVDDIRAQTLGPIVVARHELTENQANHEAIHVFHWVELAIAASVLVSPLALFSPWALLLWLWAWAPGVGPYAMLHGAFWVLLLIDGHSRKTAYQLIPFEIEAYVNQRNLEYLEDRPWFEWMNYT